MNIGLIDVDGHNFPNLALMKISAYHKQQGDQVEMWNGLKQYDKVYMSKVFDFTPDIESTIQAHAIVKGGTGYGLERSLPHHIEHMIPDYSLYPQFKESYGFLTRGCPRACKFCIVSEKEGRQSVKVADLLEFYTKEHKTIKLLDPNLLACKDRENLLEQLINSGAWVDFTQGLDIRLIDKDAIVLLDKIKIKMVHFAWDNPKDDLVPYFKKFDELSNLKDERKRRVYVLTNFNSTHQEDLERIYTLKLLSFDPYVMIYDKQNAPKQTRRLQRWVNNKFIFRSCEKFEDYKS